MYWDYYCSRPQSRVCTRFQQLFKEWFHKLNCIISHTLDHFSRNFVCPACFFKLQSVHNSRHFISFNWLIKVLNFNCLTLINNFPINMFLLSVIKVKQFAKMVKPFICRYTFIYRMTFSWSCTFL